MVRTIFVTGANQGLGMHTVNQLGATSDVISLPVQLDLTDAASIKAAHAFVADFLQKKGISSLDVLVNNAAIVGKGFEDTFATNVFGTVATPPLFPAYASSKSALNMLTVQWSLEEEKKGSGIRVVSICPGYNATNLNNYAGTMAPSEGCKVIVKTALEQNGKTRVFIHKDGEYPW
ncbi:oxidoreductase [Mycena olivaceomarginata]|nr:oxidoreductase [Mycena olivaceomarginata]